MNKVIKAGAFCVAAMSSAAAMADTTLLRCFYKANSDSTDTEYTYVWGLNSKTSIFPKTLSGHWWNNALMNDPANMFYTDTSQAALKRYCQNAFDRKGITQPLVWMAAGSTSSSLYYTIWSNDVTDQQPDAISKLIVFGDSASDNQNLYSGTQHLMPYHGSWFMGRFSNGPVWNEYLAENLSIPNYNWAVAGAAADDYVVIPGVVSQVESYLAYMDSAPHYQPQHSLFTMLIGGNDLVNYDRSVDDILSNQRQALEKLIAHGAKHILLLNLPPFDRAPVFVDSNSERDDADTVRAQIEAVNAQLPVMAAQLKAQYPAINLQIFDAHGLVSDLVNNPAQYGKVNRTDSCLDLNDQATANYLQHHARRAECTNADQYVFWDRLHPTTHSHRIIGEGLFGQGGVAAFVRQHYPL